MFAERAFYEKFEAGKSYLLLGSVIHSIIVTVRLCDSQHHCSIASTLYCNALFEI